MKLIKTVRTCAEAQNLVRLGRIKELSAKVIPPLAEEGCDPPTGGERLTDFIELLADGGGAYV